VEPEATDEEPAVNGRDGRKEMSCAMRILGGLRRFSHGTMRIVGHIADEPAVTEENGTRYLVFHLSEVPGVVFRLKMFPTTPRRHQGDRVEVGFTQTDGVGTVESLFAAPDPDVVRKRRKEHLADTSTGDTDR
jgi:hypothetical protein